MPHYKDGTVAKVGDQVTGKLYNSEGIKAGVIISVTPGQESCNAMVRFVEVVMGAGVAVDMMPIAPRMAIGRPEIAYSANHRSSGHVVTLYACEDYCATNELTKVG